MKAHALFCLENLVSEILLLCILSPFLRSVPFCLADRRQESRESSVQRIRCTSSQESKEHGRQHRGDRRCSQAICIRSARHRCCCELGGCTRNTIHFGRAKHTSYHEQSLRPPFCKHLSPKVHRGRFSTQPALDTLEQTCLCKYSYSSKICNLGLASINQCAFGLPLPANIRCCALITICNLLSLSPLHSLQTQDGDVPIRPEAPAHIAPRLKPNFSNFTTALNASRTTFKVRNVSEDTRISHQIVITDSNHEAITATSSIRVIACNNASNLRDFASDVKILKSSCPAYAKKQIVVEGNAQIDFFTKFPLRYREFANAHVTSWDALGDLHSDKRFIVQSLDCLGDLPDQTLAPATSLLANTSIQKHNCKPWPQKLSPNCRAF